EGDGLRAVEARVGDFSATVRGQAVHKGGARLCVAHELVVDLEGNEDGSAAGGLVLLAHGDADVGVDGVGAGGGLDGVVREGERAAGGLGDLDGLVDDVELGLEALGCGDGDVGARQR